MKFRVIFLKKKHIYYALLILVIIILLAVFISTRKTSPTFNTLVDNSKMIQTDLTGDGKKDILYIKTEKDKYYMEVNTGEKSFYLEPDKKMATAGIYDPYNPLKVTLMDVTRDKVPEIFIQSSQNGKGVQHVFIWDDGKFKDVFCSSNSILGFADCSNNKTPKFLSGKITSNKIEFSNYIFIPDSNKLEKFAFNHKDNYMGRDTILSFIKYIGSLPEGEAEKPANIFYPGLNGDDISLIGKLSGENNTYVFQNCVFKDNKSDKNGDITEALWTLNFKAASNTNKKQIKNYSLNVLLKPNEKADENYLFKIYSIKLAQ